MIWKDGMPGEARVEKLIGSYTRGLNHSVWMCNVSIAGWVEDCDWPKTTCPCHQNYYNPKPLVARSSGLTRPPLNK